MSFQQKKYIANYGKVKSASLLVIYVFLLILTTIHFHPFNLVESRSFFNKIPIESSDHNYSAENCPIINFAQNGFNGTNSLNVSSLSKLKIIQQIVPCISPLIKKEFTFSFQHRGPPSL